MKQTLNYDFKMLKAHIDSILRQVQLPATSNCEAINLVLHSLVENGCSKQIADSSCAMSLRSCHCKGQR